MLYLLAIVGEFDWTTLSTQLGFGAFVIWFAWHTQTHTIPALLTQHQGERDSTRKDFLLALAEARNDYLAAEKMSRGDYISLRTEDRIDMHKMAEAITKIAEMTQVHVGEARAVWASRGEVKS